MTKAARTVFLSIASQNLFSVPQSSHVNQQSSTNEAVVFNVCMDTIKINQFKHLIYILTMNVGWHGISLSLQSVITSLMLTADSEVENLK